MRETKGRGGLPGWGEGGLPGWGEGEGGEGEGGEEGGGECEGDGRDVALPFVIVKELNLDLAFF